MSFKRQPLLNEEQEAELMAKMEPLWLQGMPAEVGGLPGEKLTCTEIAKELQFSEPTIKVNGEEKENPYAKLKLTDVPYYRLKFAREDPASFPIRNKPPFAQGEDRYKLSPLELMNRLKIMKPRKFVKLLNEKVPQIDSFYYRRVRSFLLTLYYTALRSSEIYERVIDIFEINNTVIIIHLLRKKKQQKSSRKDEPIDIPRVMPLAEEIVDWLEGEEWKKEKGVDEKGKTMFNLRPWEISRETARNYTKELNLNVYPHFFRFNFVTSELNYPDTTIGDLISKTALTLAALDKYAKSPERVQKEYDRKRIKRFKKLGVIK